ncbi:MAG: tRNA pseudouridine(38-40) synthase TruA, partial [Candidatus Marinimicrobia bacterium]|nr:tRNA pseudouridine(38-40) synthase TruA [Candidatus Neomarinimicrobiota bacterium]
MSRYKVTLQYDGAKFLGWQLQPKGRTVQGDLEKVLRKISNQKTRIPVHGAGRTDTGVHAMGQVAHFDFETRLSDGELIKALNGNLSLDCR